MLFKYSFWVHKIIWLMVGDQKNLLFIFYFIIKFAGYYIHKVRWFLKKSLYLNNLKLTLKCIWKLYLKVKTWKQRSCLRSKQKKIIYCFPLFTFSIPLTSFVICSPVCTICLVLNKLFDWLDKLSHNKTNKIYFVKHQWQLMIMNKL